MRDEPWKSADARDGSPSGISPQLLDGLLEGCAVIGFDWTYLYVNEAAARQLQRERESLLGQSVLALGSGVDGSTVHARYRRCMEERIHEGFEAELTHVDGATRWYDLSVSPVPEGIFVLSADITDRKRAEEALRASEETFRLAFENANFGICMVDTGGRLVRVNREMSAIFGYSKEELEGTSVNDIAHPDYLEVSPAFIGRAEAGEVDRAEFEKAYIHKDGSLVWGRVSSSLVRDAQGGPVHFISHVVDVTDRKRAEELLRASEARYRFLAENMVDVVWALDPNTGRFTYVSPSVEQLRGYTPEEVMAEPVKAALAEVSVETVFRGRATVAEAVAAKGYPPLVHLARVDQPRRDGSIVQTEVVTKLITDDDGRIVEVLGVTRDITERVKAEQEILRLNADLEQRVTERTSALTEANQELESFSYSVSHDLRAPLRAINGFTALLSRHLAGGLDEEGSRFLRTIGDNGLLMGSLVDGLLDFTRARSRDLKRVPLDMKQLAEEVVVDLVSTPGREHVKTVVGNLPPAHADRGLSATVLRHLLSNAIKFSSGRPEPAVEVGFDAGPDGDAYFVRDNGIGFDGLYADRLFRVFERLDGPPQVGHTGIGLALVKRIVERHGGRVWAEGAIGEGATFYFTLAPPARARGTSP